jgi:predicted RNA binding protein YcfA (HicA-like mRNA interferase family)
MMKAREVNKRIEALGGVLLRQRGSHRFYEVTNERGTARTLVAQHNTDIPTGTLSAIQKQLEPVLGKGWLK